MSTNKLHGILPCKSWEYEIATLHDYSCTFVKAKDLRPHGPNRHEETNILMH